VIVFNSNRIPVSQKLSPLWGVLENANSTQHPKIKTNNLTTWRRLLTTDFGSPRSKGRSNSVWSLGWKPILTLTPLSAKKPETTSAKQWRTWNVGTLNFAPSRKEGTFHFTKFRLMTWACVILRFYYRYGAESYIAKPNFNCRTIFYSKSRGDSAQHDRICTEQTDVCRVLGAGHLPNVSTVSLMTCQRWWMRTSSRCYTRIRTASSTSKQTSINASRRTSSTSTRRISPTPTPTTCYESRRVWVSWKTSAPENTWPSSYVFDPKQSACERRTVYINAGEWSTVSCSAPFNSTTSVVWTKTRWHLRCKGRFYRVRIVCTPFSNAS